MSDWARALPEGARAILAVAGAPGSGKSTLAEDLCAALGPDLAAILPMDGFHYDDEVLVPRGDRPRKGAPFTFDVGGFASVLARLRTNIEDEVAVPRFDRDIEIARAGARIISRGVRLIVAEGNYLLLDAAPWSGLAKHFDKTAFLDVPMEELERRLHERWESHGMSDAAGRDRVAVNDLPNARLVVAARRAADWVVT